MKKRAFEIEEGTGSPVKQKGRPLFAGKTDMDRAVENIIPITVGGGSALLAHSIASSALDKSDEEKKKDSIWSKVLSAIIPIGAGAAGALGGWKLGKLIKGAGALKRADNDPNAIGTVTTRNGTQLKAPNKSLRSIGLALDEYEKAHGTLPDIRSKSDFNDLLRDLGDYGDSKEDSAAIYDAASYVPLLGEVGTAIPTMYNGWDVWRNYADARNIRSEAAGSGNARNEAIDSAGKDFSGAVDAAINDYSSKAKNARLTGDASIDQARAEYVKAVLDAQAQATAEINAANNPHDPNDPAVVAARNKLTQTVGAARKKLERSGIRLDADTQLGIELGGGKYRSMFDKAESQYMSRVSQAENTYNQAQKALERIPELKRNAGKAAAKTGAWFTALLLNDALRRGANGKAARLKEIADGIAAMRGNSETIYNANQPDERGPMTLQALGFNKLFGIK